MRLIFITGSSGIGKSTLVPLLKSDLPDFDTHDFDEKLSKDVAMNRELLDDWRKDTTGYWIRFAEKNFKPTIVLGLVYPSEVRVINSEIIVEFILLDVSDEEIKKRLMGKRFSTTEKIDGLKQATGLTPEEFIEENELLMKKLRQETLSFGGKLLDITTDTPEETANKLKSIISS